MELQWPLILFTCFLAWSAGVFGAQGIYALRGKSPQVQLPALVTSLVLLVVGGIAVFMHLEHWERIFNGFGHITSGITQELIAIVLMVIVMVVYFVFLRREEGAVPKWAAVCAIVVAALLVIVMAHSYMMASRPAWSTMLWVCAILGNALVMGPATMAVIAGALGCESDVEGPLVLTGALVNAVCSAAWLVYAAVAGGSFTQVEFYYDLTHPMKEMQSYVGPFSGDSLMLSVVGVIVVGLLGPIACALVGRKKGDWKVWGTLALVCAIIGAVCLRMVFYLAGQSVFMFY